MFLLKLGDGFDPASYPDATANVFMFDPPFIRPYKPRSAKYPAVPPLDLDKFPRLVSIMAEKLADNGWVVIKCDMHTALSIHPLMEDKFEFYRELVWDKNFLGLGWKVRRRHELIILYTHKGKKGFWKKGRALPSILKHQYVQIGMLGNPKVLHVNQTPPALWEDILLSLCPEHGTVFDPFMGTASIGLACLKLGLNYLGIEISKEIFNIAREVVESWNSTPKLFTAT